MVHPVSFTTEIYYDARPMNVKNLSTNFFLWSCYGQPARMWEIVLQNDALVAFLSDAG